MKYRLLALFTIIALQVNAQTVQEIYQYTVTPVTDSTWNLDVINITTNPQQITRYSNFTKRQIDEYFYNNLLSNYNIMSINKNKYLAEEIRSTSTKNILSNVLNFDYDLESEKRFKDKYKGKYLFATDKDQAFIVDIDTSVYTTINDVDTIPIYSTEYVYDTSYVDVITDSLTIVDTVYTLIDSIESVSYQYQSSVTKVNLYNIIPKSDKYFVIKQGDLSIELFSEDKISWIGKDVINKKTYFLKKL